MWSGYFSSRPALKGYIRSASSLLQAAWQLAVRVPTPPTDTASTATLEASVSVAQHHDAVTGTSKQHVADDYARQLAAGAHDAYAGAGAALAAAMNHGKPDSATQWVACPAMNVSVCAATAQPGTVGMVVYNPLPRAVTRVVLVPVGSSVVSATNATGGAVTAQVFPADATNDARAAPDLGGGGPSPTPAAWTVAVKVALPAQGFSTVFLGVGEHHAVTAALAAPSTVVTRQTAATTTLSNGLLKLLFDGTGHLTNISSSTASVGVSASLLTYTAYDKVLDIK